MFESFLRKHFYKYRYNNVLRFCYTLFSLRSIRLLFTIWFWKDFFSYKNNERRFSVSLLDIFPVLHERTKETSFDAHYVYHPAWAIRKVLEIANIKNIDKHIDFSSTLHFCANLSSFIPVEFYDYRPASLTLPNLKTGEADITDLTLFKDSSLTSLSCMHVVEHVGLGRYGDVIDPSGDIKAVNELKRVCAVGGDILFVVPVGKEKVQFNAHRIYSYKMIKDMFGKNFELKEFSLVTDNKEFIQNISSNEAPSIVSKQNYGCGCFWFTKSR